MVMERLVGAPPPPADEDDHEPEPEGVDEDGVLFAAKAAAKRIEGELPPPDDEHPDDRRAAAAYAAKYSVNDEFEGISPWEGEQGEQGERPAWATREHALRWVRGALQRLQVCLQRRHARLRACGKCEGRATQQHVRLALAFRSTLFAAFSGVPQLARRAR